MKPIFRVSALLALLLLAACGTLQVDYVPAPTFTPYVPLTPTSMSFAIPPEQCSQLEFEGTLPANPDDPKSYVGHHYNELSMPDGLAFNAGGMITDEYLWEWVSRPDADMEFLTQTICRRTDGSPYNTVVDAIQIPRETPGYGRAGFCLPDHRGDSGGPFIVFGRYDQTKPQVTLDTAKGWAMFNLDYGQYINLDTVKFEPYALQGLECLRVSGMG
ncbi:MAG: hypothetical protein ACM3QS_05530 [Bacteroidota bacterium]